LLNA